MLCTISVRETACQKYFFQILSPQNAQTVNLKNLDLYLIRGIHPKRGLSGFMIRVWIPPPRSPSSYKKKNLKNPFLDKEIRITIFQQTRTQDFPSSSRPGTEIDKFIETRSLTSIIYVFHVF